MTLKKNDRAHSKAQGSFEYIIMLAAVLLVVGIAIILMRYGVLTPGNQTLQAGLLRLQQELLANPETGLSFAGCDDGMCDGAVIGFGQAVAPGQTVVTIFSVPSRFSMGYSLSSVSGSGKITCYNGQGRYATTQYHISSARERSTRSPGLEFDNG